MFGENIEKTVGSPQHALQATILVTIFLYVKFLFTTMVQGGKKGKAGLRAPEDARSGSSPITGVPNDAAEAADRWSRIVANDQESLPWAIIIAWAALVCLSSHSAANYDAHIVFVSLYLIFRVFHTVCYAFALMPWRSIMWIGGVLCILGMGVNGCVTAFAKD